jgi:hypothetical protein
VWTVLAAVAHNATSITVFDGIIKATSCLDLKGMIRLELSGKRPLGPAGALQLGQALADSATPSTLTALEVRLVSNPHAFTVGIFSALFVSSLIGRLPTNDSFGLGRGNLIQDEGASAIARSISLLTSLMSVDLR